MRYDSKMLSEAAVAQLLVRNVPDDVADALRRRAIANRRSVEAEHRLLLEEALKPVGTGFWERAAELRARVRGRIEGDSADLIRIDRDER
jgi:plasmid stability protein